MRDLLIITILLICLGLFLLAGCGGGNGALSTSTTTDLSLTADKAAINPGDSTTLHWNSTNATAVVSSSFGSTTVSGSLTIKPIATTTYTITVTGSGGQKTANITITVSPIPTLTLTADNTSLNLGVSTYLRWNSTNATSVVTSSFGATSVSGSLKVTPNMADPTIYSLTVAGQGGQTTASVSVAVAGIINGAMQDLGTLGGVGSEAMAINSAGQVVGYSYTSTGDKHAFFWTPTGGMQDLGTLGGGASEAYGINNNGQVVGDAAISGNASEHAFLWTAASGMRDLDAVGELSYNQARGINDAGVIVGSSFNATSHLQQAIYWASDGSIHVLNPAGLMGSYDMAYGINHAGHIAGVCVNGNTPPASEDVFLWTPGSGLQDIGKKSGSQSSVYSINDSDQIIGMSGDPVGGYFGFLWSPVSGLKGIGGLNFKPNAINNAGLIAGEMINTDAHAILCMQSGALQYLDTLGGMANGINDAGQIVGAFSPSAGTPSHAFLWTPTTKARHPAAPRIRLK